MKLPTRVPRVACLILLTSLIVGMVTSGVAKAHPRVINRDAGPPEPTPEIQQLPLFPGPGNATFSIAAHEGPHVVWMAGTVELSVLATQNQTVWCMIDNGLGLMFLPANFTFDLVEGTNTIVFPLKLVLEAMPGRYSYRLQVSVNAEFTNVLYRQNHQTYIALGLPSLVLVFVTLGGFLGIAYARNRQKKALSPTPAETSAAETGTLPSTPDEGGPQALTAPPGKIRCPSCKKVIEEGTVFCPECGHRIPEYYRYNPNSN